MIRTLAFVGVAAVAYNQLKKSGSLDRFKADVKRRVDDLRSHVDATRDSYKAKADDSVAPPAGAAAAPAI
jgi:hypothetical protein